METSPHRRAATVAAMALLVAMAWVGLNVGLNYGGHVSGLFWTGAQAALPEELAGAHTRRVADPVGYDGQFIAWSRTIHCFGAAFSPMWTNPPLVGGASACLAWPLC